VKASIIFRRTTRGVLGGRGEIREASGLRAAPARTEELQGGGVAERLRIPHVAHRYSRRPENDIGALDRAMSAAGVRYALEAGDAAVMSFLVRREAAVAASSLGGVSARRRPLPPAVVSPLDVAVSRPMRGRGSRETGDVHTPLRVSQGLEICERLLSSRSTGGRRDIVALDVAGGSGGPLDEQASARWSASRATARMRLAPRAARLYRERFEHKCAPIDAFYTPDREVAEACCVGRL
jgi:hypothetical protein